MVPSPAPKMKGEKLAKAYALPEGKLKALTALMVRNDVPVLVSPGKSEITVHGTPVEQAVFGWFVKLISDEETREFKLEPGKAEALIALMSRDDVPVLISPMEGGISVKGSPAQLDIFADFVNLISGKPITSTAALPADASKRLQAGIQAYQDMLKPFTDEQWQKQWQHQWKWAEKAYRDSGHEAAIKAQRQALEKQIEHMHRQIEELNRKVEQMKKQAQKLREKAEGLAGAARSSIEAKVEQTNVVIEAINETIDQLRDEADGLAEKLDSLADRSGERQERRVASGVAG
jgi:uncharacterized protein YoxC